ncbi:accessory factor UbiK family protein [Halotalea alkalilenta]|uniref:accessory factor UbiK family protein n=1 Tax=Halotalea alkalilenta TaxID=376489 RepID=UPI000482B0CE|nr:accessory factor UbiK family protein [Halotalea alkalilenta]
MTRNDVFSRLAQQIGERLSSVSQAPEEIQRSVQGAMKGAFDRLDLVSREDFDIMMDVLTRTRTRVEALEKQLAALEARLGEDVPSTVAEVEQRAAETAAEAKALPTEPKAKPGKPGDAGDYSPERDA